MKGKKPTPSWMGVVWTRPVYKSEINIDGWAKLTGMVASDGLWQPPPAWGCLGWPPYSLHPIESEWWPHLLTGSHYKPKQETFISIRSPQGDLLNTPSFIIHESNKAQRLIHLPFWKGGGSKWVILKSLVFYVIDFIGLTFMTRLQFIEYI